VFGKNTKTVNNPKFNVYWDMQGFDLKKQGERMKE
jgi:hypothetical protein